MTRIFDNIDPAKKLGPELVQTFAQFDRLDAAVGYFDLRGWAVFKDIVDVKAATGDQPVARVLIGMSTASVDQELVATLQAQVSQAPEAAELVDREIARARRDNLVRHLREQLVRGMPREDDRQTLRILKRQLESGAVEVKVHTSRPLHGKTYVFHRDDHMNPVAGYVGSSNLTRAGLSSNFELNVDVVDYNAAKDLAQWFVDRWEDPFSFNLTADIIELIEESWADHQRTPYEVFLKLCYHLSRDVREGLAEYSLPPVMQKQLLEYQSGAVRTLARRIETRGGAMLGDVVGLGKTITAVATALMLNLDHGYSTLVICPKNLVSMWEDYLDAYDVPHRVVPYSQAVTKLPELRRFQFVICDESHTMRNDTRSDYKAIQRYIEENSSKVLLLTATPYNIRFQDVANQLGLYIDDDQDLGIEPAAAMALNAQLRDQVDGKVRTLAAFRRSEEADDWKRLMGEHLVRRTRSFIKSNYADKEVVQNPDGTESEREFLTFANGDKFFFPKRVAVPVEHSFGADDPAVLMESDDTLDSLRGLLLARYRLADYLKKGVELTAPEADFVDRIGRGRGQVAGFVRTSLYKRLSSCGYSFILSLQRIIARNELYIYALSNGLDVPIGTLLESMLVSNDDEDVELDDLATSIVSARYEQLRAAASSTVEWVSSRLFNDKLAADLRTDNTAIADLLSVFGPWTSARDSKMAEIIRLVADTHGAEKILIFTEYKDTAEYVHRTLVAAGVSDVDIATGSTDNPNLVAKHFSPRSNKLPGEDAEVLVDGELRVLVATDVLSEGQNLQDAHIVVNYDLPWAIIRLIQRAGRVDRVGQDSDTVLVYSFFHGALENVLNLRGRIAARLEASAAAFGSDEAFFGTARETAVIGDLYDGKIDDQEIEDEVDASSIAFEVWSNAEKQFPDLAKRIVAMPDMVSSTRARYALDSETGVACFVRTGDSMDGFAFGSSLEDLSLLTGHEALRIFRAEPSTPTVSERSDHLQVQEALIHGPLSQRRTGEGQLRGVRKRIWNELSGSFVSANAETGEALGELYRSSLTKEAESRLKRALASRSTHEELADLLSLLSRDGRLVISSKDDPDEVRIVCSMGVSE